MLSANQIYLFIISAVVMAFAPGPDILTVLARGISQGRREAFAAATGFALGCINHTLILVLGVAALLKASPTALTIIKWGGAFYLIYIGIQMIRSRKSILMPEEKKAVTLKTIFMQSVLANLLNPKVILFFLSFLPQFVRPEQGSTTWQLLQLGVLFMLATWAVFCGVAFFADGIGQKLQKSAAIFPRMQIIAGIFLIALGLGMGISKL